MNHAPDLPGIQTRKAKRKAAKRMKEDGVDCLQGLFGSWLDVRLLETEGASGGKRQRRVYDRGTTFMLFLVQIIGGFSCADMVEMLGVSKAARGGLHGHSPKTGGYRQARRRLELPEQLPSLRGADAGDGLSANPSCGGIRPPDRGAAFISSTREAGGMNKERAYLSSIASTT